MFQILFHESCYQNQFISMKLKTELQGKSILSTSEKKVYLRRITFKKLCLISPSIRHNGACNDGGRIESNQIKIFWKRCTITKTLL